MDTIFNSLTTAMTGSFEIALAAAFGWGVMSILLSPCHLSSIPLIVGYISAQGVVTARRSAGLSVVFAVGILITIALVGFATASLGRMMGDVGRWGNIFVAGIFFVIGLYLLDIVKISWGGFSGGSTNRRGWIGALTLGLLFGIGLGPCTFAFLAPVLGVVFSVSTTSFMSAALLIGAFGLGHCAIIAGAGSLTHVVQRYLHWSSRSNAGVWLRRAAGLFVLFGGIYFLSTAF
ncbi:MAG: cytochrome c biogenesis protein CcdA [Bacteroidota bacterium]